MTSPAYPLTAVILLACLTAPGADALISQDPAPGDGPMDLRARKVVALTGIGDVSDLDLLHDNGSPTLLVAGTCGSALVDLAAEKVKTTSPFALPCPPLLPAGSSMWMETASPTSHASQPAG